MTRSSLCAAALDVAEAGTTEIATRLSELVPLAATLADIVRTLAGEWGGDAGGELLFWSEATQRSMESWRRDVMQTEISSHGLQAATGGDRSDGARHG